MKLSLEREVLAQYVARQISTTFPDGTVTAEALHRYHERALERLEHCFLHTRVKYFHAGGEPSFNHLNTDQYAMYLYFLSNSIHRMEGDPALASKVYGLNKALHALDVYYEVALPDIFAWQHPVGTVLGRAKYADYFFVYQRCTVGGNLSGVYPTFDEGVILYGDTAVVGKTHIGRNTWISLGTKILDQDIEGNAIVFGRSPDIVIKRAKRDVVQSLFGQQGEPSPT
ncbi:hypothetical protein LZC95_14080 [Pendulispora brunnea]|uniref:Serine acetyltransferase n=1 Tax=Pendulispora brunnea TaxID=2905690 RepID=A0ABZ2KK29_9BACT